MKSNLPTLELLEDTHQFPCPYLFKIIGKPDREFVTRVVAEFSAELGGGAEVPYRVRDAVGGRHVSVTLEPMVQSAQQVVAIYRRLGALDGLVIMF
jgi:putative lipoic acid-binding regulatory protein